MQLDHFNLFVSDVPASRAFYEPLLAPAGLRVNREFGNVVVGFGDQHYAVLALVHHDGPIQSTHFAFRVDSRSEVDELYEKALAGGGIDNGVPGVRPHYHEHYYAGFVLDRDGHNLEFVCHEPA